MNPKSSFFLFYISLFCSHIDPVAPIVTVIKRHKVITDQKVRVTIGGSVKVKFGSQLDIRCPHFGVPTPEVSWFRNGKSLTEDDDFIIKGSGEVLRIPFVRMNDNATYICEVSNGVGRKAMGEIIVAVFSKEFLFSKGTCHYRAIDSLHLLSGPVKKQCLKLLVQKFGFL